MMVEGRANGRPPLAMARAQNQAILQGKANDLKIAQYVTYGELGLAALHLKQKSECGQAVHERELRNLMQEANKKLQPGNNNAPQLNINDKENNLQACCTLM